MRKTVIIILALMMAVGASAQQANGTYSFLRATNSARVAALGGLRHTWIILLTSILPQCSIHTPLTRLEALLLQCNTTTTGISTRPRKAA